jgi:ppGpp synthetase/RelA/SpoT-type nucleotidyltranferase
MDTQTLLNEYKTRREELERLMNTAKLLLDGAIKRLRIKIHSFPTRIKSFDSFADKVRRKNSRHPFTEIHDIVGLRVICLFRSDIQRIGDIIEDTLEITQKENTIDGGKEDMFGYMSLHYIAKLKGELDGIEELPFEVQVRTIAQDAWASVSHHLLYKKGTPLPRDLERDFNALSGLFYVADTHFSMVRLGGAKDRTLRG